MSSNWKGSDNSTTEVVDLNAHANLTTISEFNKKFVPDKRMSDLGFLNWKYKSTKPNGENITSHYGILNTSNELVVVLTIGLLLRLMESPKLILIVVWSLDASKLATKIGSPAGYNSFD